MKISKSIFRSTLVLSLLGGQVCSASQNAVHVKEDQSEAAANRLNVIIFTADDLGPDGMGIGAFGSKMQGLTPNIDKLANQGVRFCNAHVNSSICMPSRSIIATGRYGFNGGHHGFLYANEEVPTMMESFQEAGYKTGVLGKVAHSSAKQSTNWDYVYDYSDLGAGRSPSKYYERTKAFADRCKKENKPFYFMINSHDPHRPFQKPGGELKPGAEWPSKMYSPEESFVPGFLPDISQVREEMSHYYNSTRRLDDTFGMVMKAIKDAGVEKNTIVIFLSDNGIAMPFSKANCYLKSTHTAMFFTLPEQLKPRVVKNEFVAAIDLFPTIMELTGLPIPENLDGKSFLPLLKGKSQKNRGQVFTQIDYINRPTPYPMRCVQDKKFGYIFNAWSNGKTRYRNANEGGVIKAMKANVDNEEMQERVKYFRHREVEEFYDLKKDPDCIHNLINDKRYAKRIEEYRNKLKAEMESTGDPLLEAFENMEDKGKMQEIVQNIYANVLQFRKGDAKIYRQRISEMMKSNFE
ncbi:sulfatase [Marinifilum breve]|uniref:Sulfatase n=1 Tax=Marinifilum breve TaxID=2184082 RepID=A0A2V4A2W0_9BACT|nr:sulfatase [Marinifilum breve]PXY03139.1 sulfatase [Marinifilum breve]